MSVTRRRHCTETAARIQLFFFDIYRFISIYRTLYFKEIGASQKQEEFEKCWAHSPLRAAARRLFCIAIHQVSLLSHAACASMSTTASTTTTTTTTRDRGGRYGPIEWAQQEYLPLNCVLNSGLRKCLLTQLMYIAWPSATNKR